MNTVDPSSIAGQRRPVDLLLGQYSEDHRHPTNQLIHWICVPPIVWSVIALLWSIPVPSQMGQPGLWAGLAMALACAYYFRLSRTLGLAMLVALVGAGIITALLYDRLGARGLALAASAVFVLAWIGQFIGHRLEGRRPTFMTDLVYLLIGPLFLMTKVLRKVGIRP